MTGARDRAAGRRRDEDPRHGGEELRSHEALHHGEARGERAGQPVVDVVAVDGEAAGDLSRIGRGRPGADPSCQRAAWNAASTAAWGSGGTGRLRLGKDRGGAGGLGQQHPVGRNVVVPFDQRRQRTGAGDDLGVERPDGVGDGPPVAVDEKGPRGQLLRVVPGEVDLAHGIERERAR
jgi:hypothetical protein